MSEVKFIYHKASTWKTTIRWQHFATAGHRARVSHGGARVPWDTGKTREKNDCSYVQILQAQLLCEILKILCRNLLQHRQSLITFENICSRGTTKLQILYCVWRVYHTARTKQVCITYDMTLSGQEIFTFTIFTRTT